MPAVCTPEQIQKASRLRSLIASYVASEDLIRIGAYKKGADAMLDQALAVVPALHAFLQQSKFDKSPFEQTIKALLALPG